jgi:hypothetical protein
MSGRGVLVQVVGLREGRRETEGWLSSSPTSVFPAETLLAGDEIWEMEACRPQSLVTIFWSHS